LWYLHAERKVIGPTLNFTVALFRWPVIDSKNKLLRNEGVLSGLWNAAHLEDIGLGDKRGNIEGLPKKGLV
jgi:hypothetical protein